jgi:hypothetical protein
LQFRFTKPMQSRPGHWLFCKKCKTYNCGILFLQTNANKMHFFCSFGSPNPSNQGHFFFQKMQLNWLFLQNFWKKCRFFVSRFGSPNPCNQSQATDFFCKKCKQLQKIAKQMQSGDPLTDFFFVFFEWFFLFFLIFYFFSFGQK